MKKQDTEFTFEIKEHIGRLNEPNEKGWCKELNRVSFNGNAPKLDIRDWNETHDKMGKGTTLTNDEAIELMELLHKVVG